MAVYPITNNHATHRLHYTWTGWPTDKVVFPPQPTQSFFEALNNALSKDGIHIIGHIWNPSDIQMACRVEPFISPVLFTQRVKGRLQHALRQSGHIVKFSRKVGMRAIGENISDTVIQYIRNQLLHTDLADPRYIETLKEQAMEVPEVILADPSETNSGRYWYNLHLVLVVAGRYRIGTEDFLPQLQASARQAALKHGCTIKALSIMPDHVHVALRGNLEMSPLEIGLAFQNNMASECRLWEDQFYIGTFGEYSLRAAKNNFSLPPCAAGA